MKTRIAVIGWLLAAAVATHNAHAQDFAWAKRMGGTSGDFVESIVVDGSGNTYVTGYFQGTATFGAYTLTSAGSQDIFVAKLDSSGTVQWAKRMGGTSQEFGFGIAVDGSGNTYVTGNFQGAATFGAYLLTSAGFEDICVAKLDGSGTVQWAKRMGGTGADFGEGVVVDGNGNTYVTGYFQLTATFGAYNLAGVDDIFVEKLDSSGTVQWAKRMGGTNVDTARGIAVDGNGNTYVAGSFRDTAILGAYPLTSAGGDDIFVEKLDSSGTVQWAKRMGGPDYETSFDVAVDGNGNTYVAGTFADTAIFGAFPLTSAGGDDVFVEKLDSSGAVLWAKRMGGVNSESEWGLAVDGSGNTYVTGGFGGTAVFGTYNLTSSAGSTDVFAAKLDSSGTAQWAKRMGGTGSDQGRGITVDRNENTYVTGFFEGTATFGAYPITSAGSFDIFVTKLACADADRDGLCDTWERDGIDTDGNGSPDVQLWDMNGDGHIDAEEKANPNIPDVYVEVDWMAGHMPNWDALNQVVESFRHSPASRPRTLPSVRLHIQHGEQALLHSLALAWASFGISGPEPDFSTVKNFGTQVERAKPNWTAIREAKRMVFHYALFVHGLAGTGSSGVGEPRGNDFVVSLGGWTNNDAAPASPDKQAGTFMHELGHNLGLLHGGGDGSGCKPNHLSVMNYTRQFDNVYVNNRPLDYSNRVLPPLSELNAGTPPNPNVGLDESSGIGGSAGDRTAFGPPRCTLSGELCLGSFWVCQLWPLGDICRTATNIDASGRIDWNRNSYDADTGVSQDINYIPSASCCPMDSNRHCVSGSPSEVLQGYDDWANLYFDFRSGPYYPDPGILTGVLQVATQEVPPEEWDAADAASGPDDDGDAVANVFDNCIFIPNPDQADDDGDGSGNVGDCSPSDSDVYPDAPEINDGKDNQCSGHPGFGLVDEIPIAQYQDPAKVEYSWYSQDGATFYDVARSSHGDFSECTLTSTVQAYCEDPETPSAGTVFYYLVRAGAPNVGTWGKTSSGNQRTVACGP